MPLQATSGAASYDGFGGGPAAVPNYIEDVFSTWLYTGNGSTQTITNGIDLAGKGGLVWFKYRNGPTSDYNHFLFDTNRGVQRALQTNNTSAQRLDTDSLTSFNNNGVTFGANLNINATTSDTYVSWTFRKQAKFFDVVTYTGNGTTQNIAHSLGSTPGCIIVKSYSSGATYDWAVYHRSLGATKGVYLNTTQAEQTNNSLWNDTTPTSTQFTVGNSGGASSSTNANGVTYVAYLFAHNAGGFGLTGADNVVSCGSFTTDGSGNATVSLGYEPQWVLIKQTDGTDSWYLNDNMRGMAVQGNQPNLSPNSSAAESAGGYNTYPNATGFTASVGIASKNYIYIAIRRGPMKTPTTGTSVFDPVLLVDGSTNLPPVNSTINAPDLAWSFARNAVYGYGSLPRDRLSSAGISYLETSSTAAEASYAGNTFGFTRLQKGIDGANAGSTFNQASPGTIYWIFGRAPGFFDVVCYTGTGSATTQAHNLGVVPEMMIVKSRSSGTYNWNVYIASASSPRSKYLNLNTTGALGTTTNFWGSSGPTSTTFSLDTWASNNDSGATYVAYLFASCPGVSKVFSFTGNGSSQTINCGFTGGARFVMIKRTDSTGDWYVWDTARGIVANNDPHLSLNSTAAEVTTNDTIDTDSTGFVVNQVSATNVNVNGASYIGLAIA